MIEIYIWNVQSPQFLCTEQVSSSLNNRSGDLWVKFRRKL